MIIFTTLLSKLLPLYVVVLLGWLAGRYLKVQKESIAPLLIYVISPVIVFNGLLNTEISVANLSLPILYFVSASMICVAFYFIARYFWSSSEKNIIAFAAGAGNTGYFGLPVVLALFGEESLGIAVLLILGIIVYENTIGFYITAKGQYTGKEALKKVLMLPALYAFVFGLIIKALHVPISSGVMDIISSFRGAYVVLGMMLIGLGLSQVTRASIDYLFIGITSIAKFVVWPIVMTAFIIVDSNYFNFYSPEVYKAMLLLGIVPLASNTVAFATKLGTHPEKAAIAVLLTTLFALVYIPLFVTIVFPLFNF